MLSLLLRTYATLLVVLNYVPAYPLACEVRQLFHVKAKLGLDGRYTMRNIGIGLARVTTQMREV